MRLKISSSLSFNFDEYELLMESFVSLAIFSELGNAAFITSPMLAK